MKHRLIIIVASMAFLVSMIASIFPHTQTANAADNSFSYTSGSFDAIQGPNPSGDPPRITYQKTGNIGQGVYVAKNEPYPDNKGGSCYPAIQTKDRKYDGDKNADLLAQCGSFDTADLKGPRKSITIGAPLVAGDANPKQREAFDQELCPSLQTLDQPMWQNLCSVSYANQSDMDKAAKKICDKYPDQLKDQCDDYKNGTYNPDHVTGSDGSTAPTCESGDFSFNWALCPIFDGTNAVTNWIFTNLIQPLLMTNPICLDTTGNTCDNTIYKIWSGFRIYGDIFLVIVLLVIVFGESIGGGMIDAYTAKKVLPRLLIAAILINLSIYIVALMIDITNVVGGGLGQLLTAPLKNNGAFTIQPDGITQGAIAAFGATGLLVGGFVLGVTGIALLLVGLIITGAIAMVGIFVTLILRQTIILALLLISPVAFALWCLPNTESWFKRWWDTLFQMLLVYPMIIILFAVADVMSYVTQHNGTGGTLSSIVAFMLLIIPLYLVPFTLRTSNRVLGAIHGAVSNVGKQINSVTGRRAFGGAGSQASENIRRMNENERFNRNSKYFGGVNKRVNTALSSIVNPVAAGKIYGGSALNKLAKKTGNPLFENSMGQGIINQIEQTKFDHTQKLGEKLNALGFNDRALRALMSMDDYSAGSIRKKAAELRASGNSNDRLAANQLESSAAFLAQDLYKDQEMGRADIGMAAGLAVTAQGFSNSDEVADLANRRGGQGSGLASAFVTQAQLNGQRAGMLDMKAGYGIQIGQDGGFMGINAKGKSAEERNRAVAHQVKRILTTGQSELQSAKGGSVAAMAPGFEFMLQAHGPTNADGNYEYHYTNEQGQQEKLEFSPQDVQRVATMLGTAQGSYSGTAAGTNAEIQKIIDRSHLSGDVDKAYKSGRRENIDAELAAGGGQGAPEQGEDK
ncbi:MAG TPA: MFS transporter [Candidatus Saccharimonadales bacterium]|nr:MFS transporter [Candidatus Saccharimonadales bacterium]